MKIEIYPASQLGAIPRMVEGVSLGTIEAFITPTAFMTPISIRASRSSTCPACSARPSTICGDPRSGKYRDHLETMFLDSGLRVIGAIYNSPTIVLTEEAGTDTRRHSRA